MMSRSSLRSRALLLGVGAAAAALSLLSRGITYGIQDHSMLIPIVRHAADPSAYAGDYLFGSLEGYATLFYGLLGAARLSEVHLTWAFTAGALLLVFGVLTFWASSARRRGSSPAEIVAGAFVLAAGYNPSVGHSFLEMSLSHALPGILLSLAALALFAGGMRYAAWIALGVALNVHGMYALFMLAILMLASLERPVRLGPLLAAPAIVLVLGAPVLMAQAAGHPAVAGLEEWIRVLRVRDNHHIFVSDVRWIEWVQCAAYLLVLARPWRRGPDSLSGLDRAALVVGFAGVAAAVLFIEWHPVATIVRLHPLRATFWLFLVTLPRWVRSLAEGIGHPRPAVALAATVAAASSLLQPWSLRILALALFAALLAARAVRRETWAAALSSGYLGAVVVVAGGPFLWRAFAAVPPGWWPKTGFHTVILAAALTASWIATQRRRAGDGARAPAVVLALMALLAGTDGFLTRGGRLFNEASPEWQDVQRWARRETGAGATFIIPVHLEGFRVGSWRNQYVDWKDGTLGNFNPDFAMEWWRRMTSLGFDFNVWADKERPRASYRSLTADDICRVAARDRADYVVAGRRSRLGGLPLLYENAAYEVRRIACPPQAGIMSTPAGPSAPPPG